MPLQIVRQDITKMTVDAVVNAANAQLLMGGGVCGAIFKAAGSEKLQRACNALAPIATGEAVLTPGFDLPCKHIVHTVGPVYHNQSPQESAALLRSAYRAALTVAADHNCQSIAFPLISSGIFGYPKVKALQVATDTIEDFLQTHELDVYLAVFDRGAFAATQSLLGKIDSYIDQHYVEVHTPPYRSAIWCEPCTLGSISTEQTMEDMLSALDKPFGDILLQLIDQKNKTDVEVYKKANIDRKLFSKIRTGKGYVPSKRTVIALALALELSLAETDDLLECAGYALSHSQKFDVIIEFFILQGTYDLLTINEVLFQYELPLLGT